MMEAITHPLCFGQKHRRRPSLTSILSMGRHYQRAMKPHPPSSGAVDNPHNVESLSSSYSPTLGVCSTCSYQHAIGASIRNLTLLHTCGAASDVNSKRSSVHGFRCVAQHSCLMSCLMQWLSSNKKHRSLLGQRRVRETEPLRYPLDCTASLYWRL